MHNADLLYTLALSMLKKVGPVNARNLVQIFGSPEEVFKRNIRSLSELKIPKSISEQIISGKALKLAEKEIAFMEKNGIRSIVWTDKEFPYRLKQCYDAPLVLYVKGEHNFDFKKVISVVGTRLATHYGKKNCKKIIEGLASSDMQIVSGLAQGIDSCAHKNALEQNISTIAVLGHSLDRIYPSQNTKLSKEITDKGLLITNFPSSAEFVPGNFPSRNRIIAGLADATLVVESKISGGSIITAELASSYNRDVFAVPGNVAQKQSAGCNRLIKINMAAMAENADDIIKSMNWGHSKPKPVQQKLFHDLSEKEKEVLNILRKNKDVRIDEISSIIGETINKTATLMLELEFKNVVRSMPGKTYEIS